MKEIWRQQDSVKILLIEDNPLYIQLLESLMYEVKDSGYQLKYEECLSDGIQTLSDEPFDVVLLDLGLPDSKGLDTLNRLLDVHSQVPIIVITASSDEHMGLQAIQMGAQDYMVKGQYNGSNLLRAIRFSIQRKDLENNLKNNIQQLERAKQGIMQVILNTVEKRDFYLARHQKVVAHLSYIIASEMGLENHLCEGIYTAGLVHDIGKISIPGELLHKPMELNHVEYDLVKLHPQIGYEILNIVDLPWPVAEIVLQHHERMDGSGYPNALTGEQILPEARILAVADVIDAMTTIRTYRPPMNIDAVIHFITDKKDILFDGAVVDAYLRIIEAV